MLGQGRQAVDDRLIGHGLVLGQAQRRFLPAHQGQGAAIEALALAQHFPGLLKQRHARIGEFRLATAAAVEQAHPQIVLQQGNRTADGRLRLALVPGHGGKRTFLGNFGKQP